MSVINYLSLTMQISQIQFIEENDLNFRVSFLADGHNLTTGLIARKAPKEEVLGVIQATANAWLAERADQNFSALKTELEGQSLEL